MSSIVRTSVGFSQDNGIEVGYKEDARDISADKLWEAILRRHASRVRDRRGELLDPALIPLISGVRSAVLNRLSHSGASSLTRAELTTALQTVKDFRNTKIPFKN